MQIGIVGLGRMGGNMARRLMRSVSAEVLSASLFTRFRSRKGHTFAEKMLSAMRNKFGGHVESYPGN